MINFFERIYRMSNSTNKASEQLGDYVNKTLPKKGQKNSPVAALVNPKTAEIELDPTTVSKLEDRAKKYEGNTNRPVVKDLVGLIKDAVLSFFQVLPPKVAKQVASSNVPIIRGVSSPPTDISKRHKSIVKELLNHYSKEHPYLKEPEVGQKFDTSDLFDDSGIDALKQDLLHHHTAKYPEDYEHDNDVMPGLTREQLEIITKNRDQIEKERAKEKNIAFKKRMEELKEEEKSKPNPLPKEIAPETEPEIITRISKEFNNPLLDKKHLPLIATQKDDPFEETKLTVDPVSRKPRLSVYAPIGQKTHSVTQRLYDSAEGRAVYYGAGGLHTHEGLEKEERQKGIEDFERAVAGLMGNSKLLNKGTIDKILEESPEYLHYLGATGTFGNDATKKKAAIAALSADRFATLYTSFKNQIKAARNSHKGFKSLNDKQLAVKVLHHMQQQLPALSNVKGANSTNANKMYNAFIQIMKEQLKINHT